MNMVKVLGLLKAILPTKRIAAWIVGVLAAVVALLMGVNNTDLKEQFCATAPVELPKIVIDASTPVEAPKPEEKK